MVTAEKMYNKIKLGNFIAKSKEMLKIFNLIEKVAKTTATVLIQGESGTGKELVARAIHYNSLRANKPFVPINCTALPETLLESELFGHEKGSFTGAINTRKGIFEEASGGTLFLDEIGDITSPLQAKLLRVLQEGEIRRVGGDDNISVDARIISATNCNLGEMVKEKLFREDLYYRIDVVSINIPPLRERIDDIPVLAYHFLSKHAKQEGKPIKQIFPNVMEKLLRYSWPGNVRELENMIETAVVLGNHPTVVLDDFPTLPEKVSKFPRKTRATDVPFYEARNNFEKNYLADLLKRSNGNLTLASKMGKISRKSLRTRAKNFGLM